MVDFTSPSAQARTLRQLLADQQEETAAAIRERYLAYEWLAHQAYGQVILAHLAMLVARPGVPAPDTVLRIADTKPAQAALLVQMREQELWMHEGMTRLVQSIFDMIAQAPAILAGGNNAA